MDRIVCVVGPTALGKTKLAVQLAKAYDGEVVSCDSMQIYKHMDIGTAKPTPEEMEGVRHHLIDIISPARTSPSGNTSSWPMPACRIFSRAAGQSSSPVERVCMSTV